MQTKNKFIIVISAIAPHFFCCILPAILMICNFIFSTSFFFDFHETFHKFEWFFLIISAFFIIKLYLEKDKDKSEKIILYITTFLFIFNLIAKFIFDV
ncbi:MAG: hypothetical protein Ta2D_08770 [Rickettsiales bacterium]|nr:MAG: hypothetical protein Ta2D_08770 [Rickettsiales bacterium]